jgi:hypothetical protein
MSRKHFEAIAKVLKEQNAPLYLCNKLADEFLETNSLFNRARFLTACGH